MAEDPPKPGAARIVLIYLAALLAAFAASTLLRFVFKVTDNVRYSVGTFIVILFLYPLMPRSGDSEKRGLKPFLLHVFKAALAGVASYLLFLLLDLAFDRLGY
jgi:hypothetical protein